MAWNEPGNKGNGDGKDPWGGGRRGNAQGPPDIDEIIKNIVNKFNSLFGSGGGGSRGGSGGVSKGATGGLLTLLLVAGVLLWAALGIYTVDASERGIVFRFGKVREAIVQPGLRWNPPLVDVVEIVNTQRVNSRSYQNEMLTSDENIINVDITIQYVIQDAKLFVVQVRDPESTLDDAAESALRHVVGSTEMDIVLTLGREELAVDVQDRLQSYIDLYQTGIQIVQVNVREVQAPESVHPTFGDLIKTLQGAETYQNRALI